MDPESRAIAERISVKVKEKGLSIAEFGELLNLKKPTVAHYLDGSNRTPATLIPRIAKVLDVSMAWVLTGQDEIYSRRETDMIEEILAKARRERNASNERIETLRALIFNGLELAGIDTERG